MGPSFTSTEDASRIIAEVRLIAEPLQRGDLPCDFTLDELFQAHTRAGNLVANLTEQVEWSLGVIDYQLYELLRYAHGYFRTLTQTLLQRDDVNERDKLLLRLSEIARFSMWPAFASIGVEYIPHQTA